MKASAGASKICVLVAFDDTKFLFQHVGAFRQELGALLWLSPERFLSTLQMLAPPVDYRVLFFYSFAWHLYCCSTGGWPMASATVNYLRGDVEGPICVRLLAVNFGGDLGPHVASGFRRRGRAVAPW